MLSHKFVAMTYIQNLLLHVVPGLICRVRFPFRFLFPLRLDIFFIHFLVLFWAFLLQLGNLL